jgi:hypothetical protein
MADGATVEELKAQLHAAVDEGRLEALPGLTAQLQKAQFLTTSNNISGTAEAPKQVLSSNCHSFAYVIGRFWIFMLSEVVDAVGLANIAITCPCHGALTSVLNGLVHLFAKVEAADANSRIYNKRSKDPKITVCTLSWLRLRPHHAW